MVFCVLYKCFENSKNLIFCSWGSRFSASIIPCECDNIRLSIMVKTSPTVRPGHMNHRIKSVGGDELPFEKKFKALKLQNIEGENYEDEIFQIFEFFQLKKS